MLHFQNNKTNYWVDVIPRE